MKKIKIEMANGETITFIGRYENTINSFKIYNCEDGETWFKTDLIVYIHVNN